jgi:hypothetical protein
MLLDEVIEHSVELIEQVKLSKLSVSRLSIKTFHYRGIAPCDVRTPSGESGTKNECTMLLLVVVDRSSQGGGEVGGEVPARAHVQTAGAPVRGQLRL